MHPVPASKTALKAILVARGAWAAVDIRDAMPTELGDVTRDSFWFNDTEIPVDAWTAGGGTRSLTFRLGITIATIREGDDSRSTEDVVWTLVEDLMTALKANSDLTGTVMSVGTVTGREANEPLPNSWQAAFIGSIECQSKFY